MSILNVARMGKFSSDRTIQEYCQKSGKLSQSRLNRSVPARSCWFEGEGICLIATSGEAQAGEIRFEAGLKVKESV